MINLIHIMLVIPLIGCLFVLFSKRDKHNAMYVTLFTLFTNILIIIQALSTRYTIEQTNTDIYTVNWLSLANINFSFLPDTVSLLLLLGIYISLVIGVVNIDAIANKTKSLFLQILYFVWTVTGLFMAADLFSFYIFFTGMLLPLFMLTDQHSAIHKSSIIYTFFTFNFISSMCLLVSALIIYKFNHGNILISEVSTLKLPPNIALVVWSGIIIALISRIPIWPFHYWIASINTNIKNSSVYIIASLIPLTGIYGFMRFWQLDIPQIISSYIPIMEIFGMITMLFISFIGLSYKNFLQKLFSYTTVYYLIFVLSAILLSETYYLNITYALFIFLIVSASLSVLDLRAERYAESFVGEYRGVLAYMPHLSTLLTFFVLVAIGLPVSSLFWNNFVIISALFKENFSIGLGAMTAICVICLALLYELFIMLDTKKKNDFHPDVTDISSINLLFFLSIIALLFLSFFNPLWFVF